MNKTKWDKKKSWERMGLLWKDDKEFNSIYRRYTRAKHCEWCKTPFDERNKKCLDHEHLINKKYGSFRNILCHTCNLSREFKTNISKDKYGYRLQITRNKEHIFSKRSQNKLYLLRLGHQFKVQNPSLFPFYLIRFQ